MAEPPVAVVGAGLMGSGIAACFAAAGYEVAIHDPVTEALSVAPERVATCLDAMVVGGAAEANGAERDEAGAAAVAAALARVRFEPRPQQQIAQSLLLSELKKQRTDFARDLRFDDFKQRSPTAARTLAPDCQSNSAPGTQNPQHFAQSCGWIGYIHKSQAAEHGIEARRGKIQLFGVHPLERHVGRSLAAGRINHPAG